MWTYTIDTKKGRSIRKRLKKNDSIFMCRIWNCQYIFAYILKHTYIKLIHTCVDTFMKMYTHIFSCPLHTVYVGVYVCVQFMNYCFQYIYVRIYIYLGIYACICVYRKLHDKNIIISLRMCTNVYLNSYHESSKACIRIYL